jgi:uncharacterized protein
MILTPFLAIALATAVPYQVAPQYCAPVGMKMRIEGVVGKRLRANLENWELRAPAANPALIEMFYDRDRKPDRKLLPWSGEFVGKYLCSSILSYRILRDPRQRELIQRVTHAFLVSQAPDGYLGPFDKERRLTGDNWDIWGHYWAIRALLMYSEEFGDAQALGAARRAADLLVGRFLDQGVPLTNDGSLGQMNYAVIHAFTKLYRLTGEAKYLAMAHWIVREWDRPGAGLYLRLALAGKEMFEFPGNRWESLHDFQGMHEMYLLTGEERFGTAIGRIWDSILKGDRHNTGGFTSGEKTTGNPYDTGAIETCCTIAWVDLSIDRLQLTGDPLVADEIELSTLNGILGAQHPSGSWWTYNTPMGGTREASFHSIVFQSRPGSPELNCCSVNGPRGLGLISEWALLASHDGFALNYYGPSRWEVRTPSGQTLAIEQKTAYPVEGDVHITLDLPRPEKFDLALRIPAWSERTRVLVGGAAVGGIHPGTYLHLARTWQKGDRIELSLDMSFHYWVGEREQLGKISVYRGPLLLALDKLYNEAYAAKIPDLDATALCGTRETSSREYAPWVLFNLGPMRLCDFATAGAYGTPYRTWLPGHGLEPLPFDRQRPVWNNRPSR